MFWPTDVMAVVMVLLSLTAMIWPAARQVASSRLRRHSTAIRPAEGSGSAAASASRGGMVEADVSVGGVRVRRRAMLFAGIAGASVLATFPSVVGGLGAATVSAGSYLLLRGPALTEEANSRSARWRIGARWLGGRVGRTAGADPALPFAIDLLAVCLRGGMATSSALRAVANVLSADERLRRGDAVGSAGPRVSVVLARVAAASELGSEPAAAWADWIGHPAYGRLARALVVTGESGSAVAGRLEAVSQQLRTAAGQHELARAQRAGVALMAPLGLCFLPAFVCLGVVPVVVGIAGRVFS